MATLTITLADLGRDLRRLPLRDAAAVQRGIARTAKVDADRWIQWSIRGGGWPGGAAPAAPRQPQKPRGGGRGRGPLRRLLAKLKALLKRKGPPRVKKAPDPCRRKEPPAYRTPIDTGDYARSWRSLVGPGWAMVYSESSPRVKAGVIEEGRRPAPIPIRPLAEWVRRKLGCQDPKKALGIAIAISKAASKRRREGLKVLARASPKIVEAARKNVDRELRLVKPGGPP